WAASCVTGACTTCVCSASVLTQKFSVRTDPEPKQYAAPLALIWINTSFFTLVGWRKRRTQRLCFARSGVCSDAARMTFICSSSAMGPNEHNSGKCKCELGIFHGFATAPILASSRGFIAEPIFWFILVFRKHLALQLWNARRAGRL